MILEALLDAHHQWVRLPRVSRVASGIALVSADFFPAAKTILDVGCGDGLVGAELGRMTGVVVTGLDTKVQPKAPIDVVLYDGGKFPFADASFDLVVLADMLHHATDAVATLREALRVGKYGVAVKDHFAFGALSRFWLGVLDRVGNAQQGVATQDPSAAYFSKSEWLDLVAKAGGSVTKQIWPLQVHAPLISTVTRNELQFVAHVVRLVSS